AFFGYIMAEAFEENTRLAGISVASEEGREEHNICKGVVRGYRYIVGNACDKMGDAAEDEERKKAEYSEFDAQVERMKKPTSDARPRRRKASPAPKKTVDRKSTRLNSS